MIVLRELRDPVGIALAAVGAVVVLLLQQGPETAVLVGVAILVFRVAAGLAIERIWPTPPLTVVPPGSPWYFPLTKRESEVAELVAVGHTNQQIADELHSDRTVDGRMTTRGVDAHVQNIFNKLGFNRRAQIAAWVIKNRPPKPEKMPSERPVVR
jgi:DNA-binding CsgD family transcriptional regulator